TEFVKRFKDSDLVSHSRKITSSGERCRTRTNEGNPFSSRLRDNRRLEASSIHLIVGNTAFKTRASYRRSLDPVDATSLTLIFLLADPTTDCRETILFTNDIRCADIVSLQNRANEMRDVDFNWTAGNAGRVLAIDASLSLEQRL